MSFFNNHKIWIIAAAILVAVGIWFGLSNAGSSSSSLITTQGTGVGTSAADQNLVSTLLALRAVKLDGTIFTEPSFQSLKDFSTQIVPEPVGRSDPFAPLTTTGAQSASSTRAAAIFAPSGR